MPQDSSRCCRHAVLAEDAVDERYGHVVTTGQLADLVPVELEVEGAELGLEVGTGVGVVIDGGQVEGAELPVDEHHGDLRGRIGLEVGDPRLDRARTDITFLARTAEEDEHLHRHVTAPARSSSASRSRPTDRLAFTSTTLSDGRAATRARASSCFSTTVPPYAGAAHGHDLDPEGTGQRAHAPVGLLPGRAELCHLPQHGDPPGGVHRGQRAQCRLHRVGIGIVGVVQHPQPGRCPPVLRPQPGALTGRHAVEGGVEADTGAHGGGHGGGGVDGLVVAPDGQNGHARSPRRVDQHRRLQVVVPVEHRRPHVTARGPEGHHRRFGPGPHVGPAVGVGQDGMAGGR